MEPAPAIEKFVQPSNRIFIDSGCSEPIELTEQLIELSPRLPDVEILHFLNLSNFDYYRTIHKEDFFRHNAFFIGESLREYVQKGMADYTPMFLSEIPRLFKGKQLHVDTALIQVSPPDQHGLCSYGINVDIVKSIAESAKHVVAEINPKMPRTFGDSFIHMDDIDAFILSDHDLIEYKYEDPDETIRKIGQFVASLIEDGSTIQMGIGSIPNAICRELGNKKDLGIHSEVFSDGVVDLVEKGVVTGNKKTIHEGKIITSFVMGSRKLYDFVDENHSVEFYPSEYVNNPYIISRNHKQVSINSALSVDLTGQVNADSMGPEFYSGIGGQVDFVRGAAFSKAGKPITVLHSTATAENGEVISRIVPYLEPGSGVVLTRGDVHYVVTEWGIADLYGKSIRERVLEMIGIAHPDFREELLEYAKKQNYVYSDQKIPHCVDGRVCIYPYEYETSYELDNGEIIRVRPVKPTDERMLQELYYSLDLEDRYLRFFMAVTKFPHKKIQPLVNIDYTTEMVLVGEYSENSENKVIASALLKRTENPSTGEIAVVVHEDWRGKGVATFIMEHLVEIAKELSYDRLSGSVLLENKPMLEILTNTGYPLVVKNYQGGMAEFVFDISG
jgi:acyl-CoA hydrolase/GNAT superfamily N-acetyltransferase